MTSPKRSVASPQMMGRRGSKADRLAQLVGGDRAELQDAWLQTFGRRPPVRLSRELIALALSYKSQCQRNSVLSDAERNELGINGSDWIAGGQRGRTERRSGCGLLSDRSDHPAKAGTTGRSSPTKQRLSPRPVRRSIKPGTRLLRAWQGQTYEVIAESSGEFLYGGKTYRSLSAIARAITGTRWSGPVFFGIATKNQAQKTVGGCDA